ncbi:MAG: sugar phosphate isomerase/epimerase family protein [Sedimentisphaerales bacterium]|jgi:sugar phosphate isomerase/epimerase|nr:sugar phosphate isomerase/epimerase family protein [Sedimentisphaerales bacterium]
MDGSHRQSRRGFLKTSLAGAAVASLDLGSPVRRATHASPLRAYDKLRLGGPVFDKYQDPDGWAQAVRKLGYSAAYCPIGAEVADDVVRAYERAAQKADIVIAEVGAWSNPISPDDEKRKAALEKCRLQLALADRIGARCCVNITGSRGTQWDGPAAENFTEETFEMIVETTRGIIDDVKPTRTWFTLETMPWAYPDSADSYVRLIQAIDRDRFAAHLDPVNLVCSPQRYYANGKLIVECFEKLGPYLKSCHAKDIYLHPKLMTHLDEVRPGQGELDYATFLRELSKLPGVPLMLEHLPNAEEYRQAAEHIRSVGRGLGLSFA